MRQHGASVVERHEVRPEIVRVQSPAHGIHSVLRYICGAKCKNLEQFISQRQYAIIAMGSES